MMQFALRYCKKKHRHWTNISILFMLVLVSGSLASGRHSILDSVENRVDLRSRLRRLRKQHASQSRSHSHSHSHSFEEHGVQNSHSDQSEAGVNIIKLIAASAASLSRFRGYGMRLDNLSSMQNSEGELKGDNVVASETAKAQARIAVNEEEKKANAKQAERKREAKQTYVPNINIFFFFVST